jgi:hypothetical protein
MQYRKNLLTFCFAFAGICNLACADAAPKMESRPKPITVGVHINQILEVNFSEDFFVIDFWLWFRWTPTQPGEFSIDDYSPVENFEIIDGQILESIGIERQKMQGFTYENVRIIAKISKRFDMKSYPVDSHTLIIRIEDQNHRLEKIQYIADSVSTTTGHVPKIVEEPGGMISQAALDFLSRISF